MKTEEVAPSFANTEDFYIALQEENTDLKNQIEELNEEANDLQHQIDELSARES